MCRVPGQEFSRDFTMDESQLPPTRLRVWLISRPKTFPHNFWIPVLPCPSIVHRFHRLKVWLPWSPRLSSSTSWVECHSSRKIYFVVISTLKLLVTTALFIVSNLRSVQTVKKQIKNAFLQTAPCYFWWLKSWFYYSSFAIRLFFALSCCFCGLERKSSSRSFYNTILALWKYVPSLESSHEKTTNSFSARQVHDIKNETRQLDDIAFLSQQPLGVNFEKKYCISYCEGEFIPVHACCQRMTTLSVLIRYQQHPCRLSKVIINKIPNESYIP